MSDLSMKTYPAFEPGQQVQCRTRCEDLLKGEVVAYDLKSNLLILKSPSTSGNASMHDLHFLCLNNVSDVKVLEEVPADYSKELPTLDMKSVKTKQAAALNERLKLVEAVGNGVSQDGIALYTALMKKYHHASDLVWKDMVKIVVLNDVIIKPPYKESDCEPLTSSTKKEAIEYVKQIVHKYWEDYNKQSTPAN